jgi:hypothetical protein
MQAQQDRQKPAYPVRRITAVFTNFLKHVKVKYIKSSMVNLQNITTGGVYG